MLTLGEAAKACGVPKSTIARAVKSGRLSAGRSELGMYQIDPAELSRVYEFGAEGEGGTGNTDGGTSRAARDATGSSGAPDTPSTEAAHVLAVRLAAAEASLAGLKQLLEQERRRGEELRTQAEKWEAQAERLTLALAAPKPAEVPAVIPTAGPTVPQPVTPRGWWPFRRSA